MKHKIKVLAFFLFVVCILALGIREVNYNNYQIIDNGTKEVIIITSDHNQTDIKILGEEIVINENINKKINNIINKFND